MDVAPKSGERRQLGEEDGILEPAQLWRDTHDRPAGEVPRRDLQSERDQDQQGVVWPRLGEEARG